MTEPNQILALTCIFIMIIGLFIFGAAGGSKGIEQWLGGRKRKPLAQHKESKSEPQSDILSDDYIHHLRQMRAYGTPEEKAKAVAILEQFDL